MGIIVENLNREYQVGGRIVTKKPHACGCSEWDITRLGADVKIKCKGCGKSLFFSKDDLNKAVKIYQPPIEN